MGAIPWRFKSSPEHTTMNTIEKVKVAVYHQINILLLEAEYLMPLVFAQSKILIY